MLARSLAVAEVIDEGEDPLASDFEGDVSIRLILSGCGSRLQPQQDAALRDALVDLVEKAGIAILMPEAAAAAFSLFAFGEGRHLFGLLRTLPGSPGLGFDEGQFLELDRAGRVEIANSRIAPFKPELFEIAADGRLINPQPPGDLVLLDPLERKLGHLPPPIGNHRLLIAFHVVALAGLRPE